MPVFLSSLVLEKKMSLINSNAPSLLVGFVIWLHLSPGPLKMTGTPRDAAGGRLEMRFLPSHHKAVKAFRPQMGSRPIQHLVFSLVRPGEAAQLTSICSPDSRKMEIKISITPWY